VVEEEKTPTQNHDTRGTLHLHCFPGELTRKSSQIKDIERIHADKTQAAWVLSPNAIEEPCVAFSRGSLLWIYNPARKGLSSYLRGHGGVRISCFILMIMVDRF